MPEIDWITTAILETCQAGPPFDPAALTLLLRQYCATGRAEIGDALGASLAMSFRSAAMEQAIDVRAAWLTLFAEASRISDDPRLTDAARDLIAAIRLGWPSSGAVADAAVSVDACLRAIDVVDTPALLPAAIDELEYVVGAAYEPGEGVSRGVGGPTRVPGPPAAHVGTASALLTAFALTGRLSYSMLAEELMLAVPAGEIGASDLPVACDAARVLCRLAVLHDDGEYRAGAVVAAGANYRRDAERLLASLLPAALALGARAAPYGLACLELSERPIGN